LEAYNVSYHHIQNGPDIWLHRIFLTIDRLLMMSAAHSVSINSIERRLFLI